MRALLIDDQLNQLHLSTLKSILMILAILPISKGLLDLLAKAEGSSQIMIGFFTISLLSASCIVAFVFALRATVFKTDLAETTAERLMLKMYQHVPMLSLSGVLMLVIFQL